MTLLPDNRFGQAPTVDGSIYWKQQYGLENVYIVADPNFSLVPGNQVGTPQMTIVNPRDMRVRHLQEGWSGSEPPALLNLAEENAATRPQHPTVNP